MSVFRPAARIVDPAGRRWEIYAYKVELRGTGRRRLRRLVTALAHGARTLRSDSWTITATARLPGPETYTWRTTGEHRAHVLAQVEGSFASGHVPQHLRHATYAGWSRSAR